MRLHFRSSACIVVLLVMVLPGLARAQGSCLNLDGVWQMDERATLKCVVTVAGATDTYTDPLFAAREVTISQLPGTCSFRYDPGSIGAGRLVQYLRTQVAGTIAGTSVSTAGGTLQATPGAQLLEASFTAHGQASDTSMTLAGSGVHKLRQTVEGGFIADLTCLLTSTAQFSRPNPNPAPAIRATQPVLQAFLGGDRISPGTWLEIYGRNLAIQARDWTGLMQGNQAPVSIDGVRVNIDSKPAYIYYVSPTQINAQAPDGIGTGPVTVEVVTAGGRTTSMVQASAFSPALLTTPSFLVGGRQYVAALFAGELNQGKQVFAGRANLAPGASFRPARPGDILTLFAVGCGPTNPGSPAGLVTQGLRPLASQPQVLFGQSSADASGYLASGFVGLCQINTTVPNVSGDSNGDLPISVTIGGIRNGQDLFITVQP
ncbi:MAG: hypothetical protein IT161_13735 [Bryobacterales bacterium]|nr:hypothetical protein [Bryobacterales bacterium]